MACSNGGGLAALEPDADGQRRLRPLSAPFRHFSTSPPNPPTRRTPRGRRGYCGARGDVDQGHRVRAGGVARQRVGLCVAGAQGTPAHQFASPRPLRTQRRWLGRGWQARARSPRAAGAARQPAGAASAAGCPEPQVQQVQPGWSRRCSKCSRLRPQVQELNPDGGRARKNSGHPLSEPH